MAFVVGRSVDELTEIIIGQQCFECLAMMVDVRVEMDVKVTDDDKAVCCDVIFDDVFKFVKK